MVLMICNVSSPGSDDPKACILSVFAIDLGYGQTTFMCLFVPILSSWYDQGAMFVSFPLLYL